MDDYSKSGKRFQQTNNLPPVVSPNMAKQVSQYRRGILEEQVERGEFRESGSGSINYATQNQRTSAGNVTYSNKGFNKQAASTQSGANFRGNGGTVRQTPEIYSPLWLNSNLNFPRDRATINAWCRSFFALNPMVHNAINLHSTYPISKLSIKCKSEKIQKFFEGMIEEIDLMNICVQIAQEYWTLGEAFPYAELDEHSAKWSRIAIQNPDYISVKHSVIAGEPIISLRPDEQLQKIVRSNRPADVQQRQSLDKSIIEHVKRGENIPLSNFYVSHLARKISPYEIRGTGLPVSIFRDLMLYDQLRESKFAQAANLINPITLVKVGGPDYKPNPIDLEAWRDVFECHDEETEVLTDQGFRKFHEVIDFTGIIIDSNPLGEVLLSAPKPNIKIACFNEKTEKLEYHTPIASHVANYHGDMYKFENEKIDLKVTPNHKLFVSEKQYKYNGHRSLRKSVWSKWKKIEAKNLKLTDYKFRSQINWNGKEIETVDVCGKHDTFKIEKYNGKVWCFTVPTGLFITRRNGKITIQSNSAQYDKDFKIFTHEAVTVERVGANSGIIDISNDITQLIKLIYIGLMVPQVLMDGGADTSYANGGVALDVLRQRYMQFRNMLTIWLRRKIFAPISKINDFYERSNGEKVLIVPDIDWNHMSLFDAGDYIQNLATLSGDPKRVSVQTLYRSLGLDWEDEKRKMRAEQIQETILAKEKVSLDKMSLNDLRSLKPDGDIKESIEEPLPGENPDMEEPLPGQTLSQEPPPPPSPTSPLPPPPNNTSSP